MASRGSFSEKFAFEQQGIGKALAKGAGGELSSGAMARVFQKVAVLGPGLLGGSVGWAMQERSAGEVRFWGRSETKLRAVREAGFFASADLSEVVSGVDLVILATPVGFYPDLARELVAIGGGFVVTDVGSVKRAVHAGAGEILRQAGIEFIGSHPMAGSEQCGFAVARGDLFQGATCFLCESGNSTAEGVAALQDFWKSLGCQVTVASPSEHDEVVARVSHLPHVLAAVGAQVSLRDAREKDLGGGGLRDTTRVAAGDPAMWTGILLENQQAVLAELRRAQQEMADLEGLLASGDEAGVLAWLTEAKARRDVLG